MGTVLGVRRTKGDGYCKKPAAEFVRREAERNYPAQARAGSGEAYAEIIEPFERLVRYQARRQLRRPLTGKISDSDVVQITKLKAFENLKQFQGSTYEQFAHWLLGIVDHVAEDESRAYHALGRDVSREVPLYDVQDKLVAPPVPDLEDERPWYVIAAWRELPCQYQQVIHWRYEEKCSYAEIGRRLGRTADAARHLYHRAVIKLEERASKHKRESW